MSFHGILLLQTVIMDDFDIVCLNISENAEVDYTRLVFSLHSAK